MSQPYRESRSKYRAVRAEFRGETYDSKFEAGVAAQLNIRLRAGEIKAVERQFKIECIPYDCHGEPVLECKVTHKVDFRVQENDGTFTLIEAKGPETADYRMRRKWLLHFWLPAHRDHEYRVVRDAGSKGRGLRWSSK